MPAEVRYARHCFELMHLADLSDKQTSLALCGAVCREHNELLMSNCKKMGEFINV